MSKYNIPAILVAMWWAVMQVSAYPCVQQDVEVEYTVGDNAQYTYKDWNGNRFAVTDLQQRRHTAMLNYSILCHTQDYDQDMTCGYVLTVGRKGQNTSTGDGVWLREKMRCLLKTDCLIHASISTGCGAVETRFDNLDGDLLQQSGFMCCFPHDNTTTVPQMKGELESLRTRFVVNEQEVVDKMGGRRGMKRLGDQGAAAAVVLLDDKEWKKPLNIGMEGLAAATGGIFLVAVTIVVLLVVANKRGSKKVTITHKGKNMDAPISAPTKGMQ